MRSLRRAGVALLLAALAVPDVGATSVDIGAPQVVLLHGLARSAASMQPMVRVLADAGYAVCNIGYPSRRHDIAALAARHVAPAVDACGFEMRRPVHFVTHSMGGIVLRQMIAGAQPLNVGRVVMLAPPNRGSEIVDRFGHWWLFRVFNGPAGTELGTGSDALPARLGPVPFAAGVIAGTRSINPLLSTVIPGIDDGKVAPARTRVDGMQDYLEVPAAHPLIMNSETVQRQTLHFLAAGRFERP